MRLEAWKFLTESWDRSSKERERLEKATLIFFDDIERDDWVACSKLIERGCSPNMALGHKTAVMVAAENGAINALRLLSSTGGNLGAQDEQGRDALFWGIETRSNDVVEFLLSQHIRFKRLFNDNSTPLIAAAQRSYVHGVRALVQHDKNQVNQFDRMGRTALWHVLSKPDMTDDDNEIARILMGAGADPDMADLDGVSPRDSALSDVGQSMLERHDIQVSMEPNPEPEPEPEPGNAPAPPAPGRKLRL